MSKVSEEFKRHAEQIEIPRLQFMGEQDGTPERELKQSLSELFVKRGIVAERTWHK